ncbi:MAG: type II toxin-antitoxin system VapC family toxin [Polyangiaceae bacterium]|nr:type II toxin-antitoxin system VapC family toxin [Polyangiaceae bacterium]
MRFWDASAVAPLLFEEAGSELVRVWLEEDADMVLWGLSRLELVSAVERRAREGVLDAAARAAALLRIDRMANDAHEVTDLSAARVRAMALLARYPLRAADAAQLGAALLVADPDPFSLTMVVLDRRLAEAAQREGLRVLSWPT